MPAGSVLIAVRQEAALELVLALQPLRRGHHPQVGVAAHVVRELQQRQLPRRLEHAALDHLVVQPRAVHREPLDPLEGRFLGVGPAVRVQPLGGVDDAGAERCDVRRHLVHVQAAVDLVVLLEVGRRLDLAHPDGVRFGQPGHVKGRPPRGNFDDTKAVGLAHPKQILKCTLLPEHGLMIGFMPAFSLPSLEKKQTLFRLEPGDQFPPVLLEHGHIQRIWPTGVR
mmetsp:Transcript_45717/g.78973  ORF Transcript_45717/g.78973 Transcript_45717/m.78973 type:complete len:225 (+) Transcript_45717:1321-1995(+)